MNRRAFLTRSLAFLPLPAFARAASLWLPKERPQVILPPKPKIFLSKSPYLRIGDSWTFSNDKEFHVILSGVDYEWLIQSNQSLNVVMGQDGWEYVPCP